MLDPENNVSPNPNDPTSEKSREEVATAEGPPPKVPNVMEGPGPHPPNGTA